LCKRVAGKVHALVRESSCASPEAGGIRVEEFLAEDVRRVLDSGLDLWTVEHRGALNTAIADEDDVAVLG
jgi:hypothetical protein